MTIHPKAKGFIKSVIITSIISGLFAIFTQYVNKPEYKVHELMSAIKTKDYDQFKVLVNQPVLVNNLYKTNRDKYLVTKDDDLAISLNKYFHLGIATLTEPTLEQDANDLINNYFSSKIDTLSLLRYKFLDFLMNFDFDSIQVTDLKEVSKRDALLTFTLNHKTYNHTFQFNSVWEKHGDNWQLVNISNIAEIISVFETLEKDRRNISAEEKTKEMMRYLEISEYKGMSKDIDFFGFFKIWRSKHYFHVKNMTNQTVVEYGIQLTFKDNQGFVITTTSEVFKKALLPHEDVKVAFWTYNPYIGVELDGGNSPDIDLTYIRLESGQEIKNNDANFE